MNMKASSVLCYNEDLLFICVVLLLLLYCAKDTDFLLEIGRRCHTQNKQRSAMQATELHATEQSQDLLAGQAQQAVADHELCPWIYDEDN